MLNVLDLCTGIGGFSLALKWLVGGFRTVCYVEWDAYCQRVIQQRIRDGDLDDAPIWSDLREFDGKPWRGTVDLITAGFPCQPFSVAGKQAGADDPRNLWPDVGRVIREVRPRYVFLENVPALLSNGYFNRVLGDLAACGYDIRYDCFPASSVGANHQRDRLWIVAHTTCTGTGTTQQSGRRGSVEQGSQDVADAADTNDQNDTKRQGKVQPRGIGRARRWWSVEPDVGRVAHGVPRRVDRLKALGNSVVPAVVAKAWGALKTP